MVFLLGPGLPTGGQCSGHESKQGNAFSPRPRTSRGASTGVRCSTDDLVFGAPMIEALDDAASGGCTLHLLPVTRAAPCSCDSPGLGTCVVPGPWFLFQGPVCVGP